MTSVLVALVLLAADAPVISTPTNPPVPPGVSTTPAAPAPNQPNPPRTLSLQEALDTAKKNQPVLKQAAADYEAARQRSFEARAPLLPQLNMSATYTRRTTNQVQGAVVGFSSTTSTPYAFHLSNSFGANLTLSQLIWDFGQTWDRWRSAQVTADAFGQDEQTHVQTSLYGVRTAFFAARAAADLLQVAADTVVNQQRHLDQVKGFVEVGTHPEIDLATALTAVANAKVQLIQAQNGFSTTRAQLNQAMGVEGPIDYSISDDRMFPVDGENGDLEALVDTAVSARPEFAAIRLRAAAQDEIIGASRGAYGPALSFVTTGSLGGIQVENLAPNWNAGLALSWNIFGGLGTLATVSEAQANLASLEAQAEGTRQSVRLDVTQSQLAVHAAVEALSAAEEALKNAKDQLRLAEGRYETGVGSIIELGDAQLALTTAAAQRVQADFNISSARAQLWHALGRP